MFKKFKPYRKSTLENWSKVFYNLIVLAIAGIPVIATDSSYSFGLKAMYVGSLLFVILTLGYCGNILDRIVDELDKED